MRRRAALGVLAGSSLAALRSHPAQAQTLDSPGVLPSATTTNGNVAYVTPSGADDTSSINQALAAVPVVILLPGVFTITGPLQFIQAGQLLTGYLGSTQAGAGSPFSVGTFNGTADIGVGVTMIGCDTEGNQLSAVHVAGNGETTYGPVQMTGCWFQGDGGGPSTPKPRSTRRVGSW